MGSHWQRRRARVRRRAALPHACEFSLGSLCWPRKMESYFRDEFVSIRFCPRTNIRFKVFEYIAAYFCLLFTGVVSEISVQAGGRLQGFRIWRNGQGPPWIRYTSQGTVNSLHFICSFFPPSFRGKERDFARRSSPKKKRTAPDRGLLQALCHLANYEADQAQISFLKSNAKRRPHSHYTFFPENLSWT